MKLHTGLVIASLLSLGMFSYSCANGDTVSGSGGSNNSGGSDGNGSGGNTNNNSGGSNGNGGSTGSGGTSSHGGSTGSGGTSSHGGSTGSGGNTSVSTGGNKGTGGTATTATGGTTGTTASNCIMGESNPPAKKLITDFSDAVASTTSAGDYTFGTTIGDAGGTSTFASPSATKGTLALATGGGLTFTASVPAMSTADMYPDNGFVVYLNGPACVDASSYTGVSFTMTTTGTCNVIFSFGDSEHATASQDAQRGTCAVAGCYASQYTVTSATTMVSFTQTATQLGVPATMVDPAKLTGVQWQMQGTAGAACSGTITIKSVSFN